MSDPATPPASPAEREQYAWDTCAQLVRSFNALDDNQRAGLLAGIDLYRNQVALTTPPAPAPTDEEVARMVERLEEEATRLQTRAYGDRCGSPDCGLASNFAGQTADLLARVARERDELQQLYMLVGEGRDLAQQRAEVAEKERDEAHRAYSELMRLREATSARLAEAEKALREMMNEAGTHTVAVGQQTGFARIWNLGQAYLAKHAGGDNG